MTTKTGKTEQIKLAELKLSRITVKIEGTNPLICHKFSEKAKLEMLEKQMKRAKSGDKIRNPEQEYLDSLYVRGDGRYGFPAIGFKAAVVSAANDAGLQKTLMRRAFHIPGEEFVVINGVPRMRSDIVKIGMGTSTNRFRAEFLEWTADIPCVLNEGVLSVAQLVNLFRIAGFGVGVGEWRPERDGVFGTWDVTGVE